MDNWFTGPSKLLFGSYFDAVVERLTHIATNVEDRERLARAIEYLPAQNADVMQAKVVLEWCLSNPITPEVARLHAGCIVSVDLLKYVCETVFADFEMTEHEKRCCAHFLNPLFQHLKLDSERYGKFESLTERNVETILTRFSNQGVPLVAGTHGWHPANVLLGQLSVIGGVKDQEIYRVWQDLVERVCNTIVEQDRGALPSFVSTGSRPKKTKSKYDADHSIIEQHLDLRSKAFEEWKSHFREAGARLVEKESKTVDDKITDSQIKPPILTENISIKLEKSAIEELDSLIGLAPVKSEIKKLSDFLAVQKKRTEVGLPVSSQTLHFVFTGAPGTGKTTVARIIGKLLNEIGILETAKCVECDRADLIANYIGQTATKVTEVIDSAIDGVLFIDEAYSLVRAQTDNDFGHEAVDTLLKRMEDDRLRLVVIVAGYELKMRQFIATNPGLQSRFTRFIHFPDYTHGELGQIFERFAVQDTYTMSTEFVSRMAMFFAQSLQEKTESFGNARFVRNTYDQVLVAHAQRLVEEEDFSKESLIRFEEADAPSFETTPDPETIRWNAACPECGQHLKARSSVIGKKVMGKCGHTFVYPKWDIVWPVG